MNNKDELFIENAKIIFPNFEGRATPYRPEGTRDFSVQLFDMDQISSLMKLGWNVKVRKINENPEDDLYHLPVTVRFGGLPPTIFLMNSTGKTLLPEEFVKMVDKLINETTNIDLKIRPYDWEVNGNKGRKAYLKIAYFTLYEDPIHEKYKDIPDLDVASLMGASPVEIEASDGIVEGEVVSDFEEYVKEQKALGRGSS